MNDYNELKEKLQNVEDYYNSLIRNTIDLFYICDLKGRAIFLNQPALEAFGLVDKDFEKVSLFDFIHPDDVAIAKKKLEDKVKGVTLATLFTIRILTQSKGYRHFQINSEILFRDGEPYAIQGIARDVTEYILAEEQLKERSRELRLLNKFSDALMRSMPDSTAMMRKGLEHAMKLLDFELGCIYRIDYDRMKALSVSTRGLSRKLASSIKVIELKDDSEWLQFLSEAEVTKLEDHEDNSFPLQDKMKEESVSQSVIALAMHGTVPHAILFLCSRSVGQVDADKIRALRALVRQLGAALAQATAHSELVRSRDSFRLVNQLWKGTFDAIQDAVLITDREGRILRVNKSSALVLGVKLDELVGRNIFEYSYQWCVKCEELFSKVLSSGKSHSFEVSVASAGKVLVVTISPTHRGETIDGTVLVIRDVSEMRRIWEHLAQTQKLESIGFLASGVAHNFNNSLMSITGNLYQLESEMGPACSETSKATLHSIEKAIDDASDTVRQLLVFSRRHTSVRTTFDCGEVVEELDFLQRAFPGNIRIQTLFKTEKRWVIGDPQQLKQTIVNLCINAKDAMSKGGMIVVEIARKTLSLRNSFSLSAGEYISLTVQDEGSGISSEDLPKIFDPFFTTKEKGKGSGLGLSLVYNSIQAMGGAITVSSKVGEGTSFEILLPTASPPRVFRKESTAIHSAKILLVEDNTTLNQLFDNFLNKQGYDVRAVTTAREALKYIEDDKPDIAVIDAFLQDSVEDELLWAFAKKFPDTSLLVISGSEPTEFVENLLTQGDAMFLMKPFKLTELDETIQKLINLSKSPESL